MSYLLRSIAVSLLFFVQAVFSQTLVSGSVQGVWTASGSPYIATADISVEPGNALRIEPGVVVQFQPGGLEFSIRGELVAKGTESQPIVFEPYQGQTPGLWNGIVAWDNWRDDTLSHCIVRYSHYGVYNGGGYNGTLRNIHLYNCEIYGSVRYGLECEVASGYFTAANTQIFATDTHLHHNGAGGALVAYRSRGGSWAKMTLTRCLIESNGGHGVRQYSYSAVLVIRNCTIVHNQGDGVAIDTQLEEMVNTVSAYNSGSAVASYLSTIAPTPIIYNLFWGNSNSGFPGITGSTLGTKSLINVNGDSCDFHFNLYEEPGFVDQQSDFRLSANSVCIDAGSQIVGGQFVSDPDGTQPDLGAYFYDQTPTSTHSRIQKSTGFQLDQNYPNPFNPTTTITFQLPRTSYISLVIFNALGQEVTRLYDQAQFASGNYVVEWNAGLLPSGMYYYRLRTNDHVATRRMIVLK